MGKRMDAAIGELAATLHGSGDDRVAVVQEATTRLSLYNRRLIQLRSVLPAKDYNGLAPLANVILDARDRIQALERQTTVDEIEAVAEAALDSIRPTPEPAILGNAKAWIKATWPTVPAQADYLVAADGMAWVSPAIHRATTDALTKAQEQSAERGASLREANEQCAKLIQKENELKDVLREARATVVELDAGLGVIQGEFDKVRAERDETRVALGRAQALLAGARIARDGARGELDGVRAERDEAYRQIRTHDLAREQMRAERDEARAEHARAERVVTDVYKAVSSRAKALLEPF